MKILAIDIGGTCSRFGSFAVAGRTLQKAGDFFLIRTKDPGIHAFGDLITVFLREKPADFYEISKYDLIVIGIAGPVINNKCIPPNIDWEVDLNSFKYSDRALLVNDFVAQSYGLLHLYLAGELLDIRIKSKPPCHGNIAVMGAGSGLGHCCLIPSEGNAAVHYHHVPSEAGQSAFSFVGKAEKELEKFLLGRKNMGYCHNDSVVSGSGLSLIHEFLTGRHAGPEEINDKDEEFRETIKMFSGLYGRACRNYCLSSFVTQALIITGGVAVNIPGVVSSNDFYREFTNSTTHKHILNKINIYLNPGVETGLLGCAYYGMSIKKERPGIRRGNLIY